MGSQCLPLGLQLNCFVEEVENEAFKDTLIAVFVTTFIAVFCNFCKLSMTFATKPQTHTYTHTHSRGFLNAPYYFPANSAIFHKKKTNFIFSFVSRFCNYRFYELPTPQQSHQHLLRTAKPF